MIIVSSHLDRVIQEFRLEFNNNSHVGLLDNFIGVLVTYLAIYDDPNLMRLIIENKLAVYHNRAEEWGMLYPKISFPHKNIELVIVVDVASSKYYNGVDFTLENIYGIPDKDIKELREDLKWQGFKMKTRKYTGRPSEEDEAWSFKKLGIPVMSMIIPIVAPDGGWHRIQQDATISYGTVKTARQALKRIINYFIS